MLNLRSLIFGLSSAVSATALPVQAHEVPKPGDYYLISRNEYGQFTGSHKIFPKTSKGYERVVYCNREYWVRPYTVAWTQVEVENGKQVRVEYNYSKGWRPICENPEEQVTLQDLGINEEARDVMYLDKRDVDRVSGINRFSAISSAFQRQKDADKAPAP